MNRNLRALRHWLACGLAVFGVGLAWAQMPVPLLDANAQTAAPPAAAQQLESLLQCKAGTVLKTDEVESRLRAIGLAKGADGFFLPPQKSPCPSLFGDEVVAALVTAADGEKKATVYLKHQTGKQMAKRLGVSKIDEQADTDEPSYFKKTSKKTTLLVGAASEVFVGNDGIKYQSAVACQQAR
ncbi:hypothetical protein GCM10022279_18020 [Comamonas faecalis]|jgi:hypothetical protein|uniref:Uncharacterized protein n=1 Tax=Comamonas faecalis TaxID=1387849 RepID=A0ABP7RAX9_9BURK